MYGYNRATFSTFSGLGESLAELAKKWRAAPSKEFRYMFQRKDNGEFAYANEVGKREGMLRTDMLQYIGIAPGFEPAFYEDPLILGGAAVVVGIIVIGLLVRKKR